MSKREDFVFDHAAEIAEYGVREGRRMQATGGAEVIRTFWKWLFRKSDAPGQRSSIGTQARGAGPV